MNMARSGLLSVALICFVSASARAQVDDQKLHRQLNGKWQAKLTGGNSELATVLTFDDGALTINIGDATINGNYKFISEKQMEITLRFGGQERARKTNFALDKDQLTLKDEQGKQETFKRSGE